MSTPCSQSLRPDRCVVSEYEVPNFLGSRKWDIFFETPCSFLTRSAWSFWKIAGVRSVYRLLCLRSTRLTKSIKIFPQLMIYKNVWMSDKSWEPGMLLKTWKKPLTVLLSHSFSLSVTLSRHAEQLLFSCLCSKVTFYRWKWQCLLAGNQLHELQTHGWWWWWLLL